MVMPNAVSVPASKGREVSEIEPRQELESLLGG